MKNKKIYIPIIILALAIIFFSYAPIITFDTSHYLWLTSMLSPGVALANWDMARGIVFPLIIYTSNVLFGVGADGVLITMFLAYLTMIGFVYLILKKVKQYSVIFDDSKNKTILAILSAILIIFNPIIFGYYHVLLTEFVGITLAVAMCYFAWNWLELDFKEDKKKYIIYTLIFAIATAFAWSLKQPYVSCVMFPLGIATLISIIRKFNIRNILQRLITVTSCIVVLVMSLVAWNKVLEIAQVPMQEHRTSSSFLSNGIIEGISQLKETEVIENVEMSSKDREEISKIQNGTSKYKNYILYENKNVKSKDMVLFIEGETATTGEAIKFWFKTLGTTPITMLRSYVNNYLATINIFDISFDGASPVVTTHINLFGAAENEAIGYKIYRDESNTFPLAEKFAPYAEPYRATQQPLKVVNIIMKGLGTFSTMVAKLSFLILPIVLIWIIVVAIKNRKVTNKQKIYNLLIVLLSFSLLHTILHIVLGANIDRYTVPAYIPMYIAYIIIGFIKRDQV